MRYSVISFTAAIVSASAFILPSNEAYNALAILRRQAVTGPCADACTPIENSQAQCGNSQACLCTATIETQLLNCASCQCQNDPSGQAQLQNSFDQYTTSCKNVTGIKPGTVNCGGSTSSSVTGRASSSSASAPVSTSAGTDTASEAASSSTTSVPQFAGGPTTTGSALTSLPSVTPGGTPNAAGFTATSNLFGTGIVATFVAIFAGFL